MVRLPIAPERLAPGVARLTLTASERHYLCDVLRLQAGARLEIFDGAGGRWTATISPAGEIELGERLEASPTTRRPVTVAQALAKADKMELVVQKATELGVAQIAPFHSERAVVRLEEGKAASRVERWRKIAAGAASQSRRADVPLVRGVTSFDEALEASAGEVALLLDENERSRRLTEAVLATEGPLWLFVGPEGGFAPEEVARAHARGALSVTLGTRVLRTETAALAALAVIGTLSGDLG